MTVAVIVVVTVAVTVTVVTGAGTAVAPLQRLQCPSHWQSDGVCVYGLLFLHTTIYHPPTQSLGLCDTIVCRGGLGVDGLRHNPATALDICL